MTERGDGGGEVVRRVGVVSCRASRSEVRYREEVIGRPSSIIIDTRKLRAAI